MAEIQTITCALCGAVCAIAADGVARCPDCYAKHGAKLARCIDATTALLAACDASVATHGAEIDNDQARTLADDAIAKAKGGA